MAPHHPSLGEGVFRDLAASIQGSLTVAALDAMLSRSMVPILRQMGDKPCDKPPELVMALLPSLVRTMLAAFVEVVAKHEAKA